MILKEKESLGENESYKEKEGYSGKDTYMKTINKKRNALEKRNAYREFAPVLRRAGIGAWILRLVPVPVGLWNARLLSRTVTGAVSGDGRSVLVNGFFLLILLLFVKGFEWIVGVRCQRCASGALQRCKVLLYRRFLSRPLSLLYGMEHGRAVELINDDFDTVTGRSINLYPGFFTGIAAFVAYFVFLLLQNIPAALCLLGISALQVIPPLAVKGIWQKNYSDTRDIEAKITDCTLGYYDGFTTIKLFGLKKWCLDRLAALHKDYLKIGNRSEAAAAAEDILDQLIQNILTYGTYGVLGIFILKGYTEMNSGVEAIALSKSFYHAVKSIFDTIPSFAVAKTAEKRLAILYADEIPAGCDGDRKETGICFDGVTCSFGEKEILSNVCVSIPAEGISVIRGANGMGKSTLLKLALGMIKPDGGSVMAEGRHPSDLSDDCFPGELFYLPQEDAAFQVSAEELYSMAPGGKADACRLLAVRFCLSEENLKQPINSLSGGQRKKVFLALAFAIEPKLMLLDEPSNSLDAESKAVLTALLRERKRGVILITHDSVLEAAADTFYTLENVSGRCAVSAEKAKDCFL